MVLVGASAVAGEGVGGAAGGGFVGMARGMGIRVRGTRGTRKFARGLVVSAVRAMVLFAPVRRRARGDFFGG